MHLPVPLPGLLGSIKEPWPQDLDEFLLTCCLYAWQTVFLFTCSAAALMLPPPSVWGSPQQTECLRSFVWLWPYSREYVVRVARNAMLLLRSSTSLATMRRLACKGSQASRDSHCSDPNYPGREFCWLTAEASTITNLELRQILRL